ncbi:hypothetical protein M5K25_022687 [Dendrobium thyrsiflorum]|uniref:Uncharacterized protein n=1 Tax=Dendrobium thyrsiflorum TaxID=117978 RepID=A0ABD0U6J2_DENTH
MIESVSNEIARDTGMWRNSSLSHTMAIWIVLVGVPNFLGLAPAKFLMQWIVSLDGEVSGRAGLLEGEGDKIVGDNDKELGRFGEGLEAGGRVVIRTCGGEVTSDRGMKNWNQDCMSGHDHHLFRVCRRRGRISHGREEGPI